MKRLYIVSNCLNIIKLSRHFSSIAKRSCRKVVVEGWVYNTENDGGAKNFFIFERDCTNISLKEYSSLMIFFFFIISVADSLPKLMEALKIAVEKNSDDVLERLDSIIAQLPNANAGA